MADVKPLVIMVTGQPRKGKSTALNNLFGLNLEARPSPKSVTTKFIPQQVEKGDQKLIVIDTPGLGALDLKSSKALGEISGFALGTDFTLIYCLSVNASDSLTITDQNIIENLHHYLHKGIWKKCIIILSFSDRVREDEFQNDELYIKHLQDHCAEFEKLLQEKGVSDLHVRSVFDYKSDKDRKETSLDGIVAVPVAKKTSCDRILPGFNLDDTDDWTDVVFCELLKRVTPAEQLKLIDFKYAIKTTGGAIAAGASAGLLGAGAGAGVGVLGGPVGIAIGAGVGGAAGAFAGAAFGTTIGATYRLIRWKKANPEKQMKKLIDRMEALNTTDNITQ